MLQLSNPHKQTTISSFFKPCKGPPKFQLSSFKSCPKQKKKRRSKMVKKHKKEEDEGTVVVQDVKENVEANSTLETLNSSGPLSPIIIFDDGEEFVTLSQASNEDASRCSPESPPKRPKTGFTQSPTKVLQAVNIAITKSVSETKTEYKLSKTQIMNTCHYTRVSENNSSMDKSYIPSLKTIIDIDTEDIELDLQRDGEVVDGTESIKGHMLKIKTIIKNSTRPNFENLLFENEKKLLVSFCSLRIIYQFICCKLFTHQIKWYNPVSFIENLRNCMLTADIVRVDEMVRILEEHGFISTDYKNEELSYLLRLLKSDDIKAICKDLRIEGKLKDKNQHIEALLTHINKQPTLNPLRPMSSIVKSLVCKKLGSMFKITESFYNTFYKIHLMYGFANPELDIPQGIYKFMGEVLYDNNIIPKYNVMDDDIFETPEEFTAFYKAYSYKEELLREAGKKSPDKEMMLKLCEEIFAEFKMIISQTDIAKHTKPGFLNRFTPGWKYTSALVFGVDKLSAAHPARVKLWLEELLSQNHFPVRKRSLLYVQLAIIYKKHYKDYQTACQTLANGLKDNNLLLSDICELIYRCKNYMKKVNASQWFGDVHHLFEKAPNAQKFPTIVINGYSDSEEPRYKYVNRHGDVEYLSVEDYAVRHYTETKGFQKGVHCEGAIMKMLFHIFFWDILYRNDIEKTFITSLQQAPLDLYHSDFYKNRQTDIDNRIADIKSRWSFKKLIDHVSENWTEASHCKTMILTLDKELVIHIVTLLNRSVASGILERFAKHYDECHAGLPDLFLWNDIKCKFVEVKGPGDHLSTKQKLWIQFLLDISADVEVCHVRRMGARP